MDRLPLTSSDPVSDRLARLRDLFPEASSDGKVDLEKLRALLDGSVAAGAERYGLSWAGKSDALKAIQKLTTATLLPAPSESVNWDTTGNAIIEGDNLEVLKVLQHAYYGKVKLIYIDPPYNTGGDFIYPDDYAEGLASYLTYLGQVKDGIKQTTNLDTSGRFHSRWLTMIYPRLFLARNLLREDGVIFVSIDDHEVANLRLVMDEIFGEENFVAQLVWEKGRKNDAKLVSVGHEYMLIYARSQSVLREKKTVWREEKPGAREIWEKYLELRAKWQKDERAIERDLAAWYAGLPKSHPSKKWSRYKRVDGNGPWRDRDISWPGDGGHRYSLLHPATKKACLIPENGWRFDEEEMKRQISLGLVEFREDHTYPPFRKAHIKPVIDELDANTDIEDSDEEEDNGFATQVRGSYFYKQSQVAVRYLRSLFGKKSVFHNPKDHDELAKLIKYSMGSDTTGLILDFFGGSGTTAQAVLELNKEDGGNRRFILVQLPEPTGREDFPTIAEITKERVRRVIGRMSRRDAETAEREREENPLNLPASASPRESAAEPGFKVFKLAESNFAIWNPELAATEPAELAKQWQLSADNVKADASETALLYELLLKSGQPLHARVTTRDAGGVTVHLLDEGRILLCLARVLTREQLRTMADWKPQSVLCLDIAFQGNDALKVNAQLEFQSHGIQFRTA